MNELAQAASRKAFWRLMPFLILCYFFAYLDRLNMSFAALSMNTALGYNAEIFGFGSGIFFIGYFLFEVPSNLILDKVGARIWIARIMITWGIISLCMIFQDASWNSLLVPIAAPIAAAFRAILWLIGTPSNFVELTPNSAMLIVTRFLLGLAEAGFFPGIILFLTYWFTAKDRAKMVGIFMAAIPLSSVIGAPVSSQILAHADGLMGLAGWKWLFILEAVPTVVLGFVAFGYLTDKPEKAHWLTPPEREALALDSHRRKDPARGHAPLQPRRGALQPARSCAFGHLFRQCDLQLRASLFHAADFAALRYSDRRCRLVCRHPLSPRNGDDGALEPPLRCHR